MKWRDGLGGGWGVKIEITTFIFFYYFERCCQQNGENNSNMFPSPTLNAYASACAFSSPINVFVIQQLNVLLLWDSKHPFKSNNGQGSLFGFEEGRTNFELTTNVAQGSFKWNNLQYCIKQMNLQGY